MVDEPSNRRHYSFTMSNPLYRSTGDPILADIARRAKTMTVMPDDLNLRDEYEEQSMAGVRHRNMVPCPDGCTWKIVVFVGGKRRTLAFMNCARLHELARLADYLVMRLWRFKSNRVGPPIAENLNYPISYAEHDLKTFSETEGWCEAFCFANEIEAHLLSIGAISKIGPAVRVARAPRKTLRKSLLGAFEERQATLVLMMDGLKSQISNLQKTVESLQQQNSRIEFRVTPENLRGLVAPK